MKKIITSLIFLASSVVFARAGGDASNQLGLVAQLNPSVPTPAPALVISQPHEFTRMSSVLLPSETHSSDWYVLTESGYLSKNGKSLGYTGQGSLAVDRDNWYVLTESGYLSRNGKSLGYTGQGSLAVDGDNWYVLTESGYLSRNGKSLGYTGKGSLAVD